jgi:hypothetical protein
MQLSSISDIVLDVLYYCSIDIYVAWKTSIFAPRISQIVCRFSSKDVVETNAIR